MPAEWTPVEREVFATLAASTEFDRRTAAERQAGPTAGLAVHVSGAFVSEVIRTHMGELPIGLQMQGVAIDGEVQIENVHVDKIISLEHCFFSGPIVARSSRFSTVNLAGSVLTDYCDMRSSVISGAVFLRWGFTSLTSTLLRDASVTGPVDCDRAVFKYDSLGRIGTGPFSQDAQREAFSLARSSASALFWRNMREPPTGIVNLRNCRIVSLRDDITTATDVARDWPAAGNLRMSGLKYEERTSTDPDALLAWIALQEANESRYGSYQTAIKLLLDSGHELSANKLIVAKQRYIAEREHSVLNRWLRKMYILLSEAGIGTDRIAAITVIAFIVSYAVVSFAESRGQFIPRSPEIVKDPCFDLMQPCTQAWVPYRKYRVPSYYPQFNAIGYTVDLFVPGISYGVAADWRPKNDWLTALTLAIRAIGLLCTGLLVVCVSGIARFAR